MRRFQTLLLPSALIPVVAFLLPPAGVCEQPQLTVESIVECCRPAEERERSHSPFGLHAAGGRESEARHLNAQFIRKIVLWQEGEPRPGQYRIAGGDSEIRKIQGAGLDLVVTLRPTSRWGVEVDYAGLREQRPNQPWTRFSGPPRDMETWLAFVREVVERYDGDGHRDMPNLVRPIRYWQIGNEIRWQWQGSLDEYLDLLKQTAVVIRDANPDARIILGALTDALAIARTDTAQGSDADSRGHRRTVEAVERVLKEGSDSYDIVDFHAYDDTPTGLGLIVCWLRQRIDPSKAIWSLENAGPFEDFSTARVSEDLVKRHLVMIACGVEGIFWSSLNPTTGWSEPYLRLALLDEAGRATPAYHTYRLMTSQLHGLTSVEVLEGVPGLRAFRAQTAKGEVFVTWSDQGEMDWQLPLSTPAAVITHIITDASAPQPRVDRIATEEGMLSLRVSTPVFIRGAAN
jgi:hypothetical protein